jgi:carbonic anhydrase
MSAFEVGAQCKNSNQSPINLSQSGAEPCNVLCDLVFDDAYISEATVFSNNEFLGVFSQTNLGSCKFNGNSYSCQTVIVNHPSNHTIENIQADGEVVAYFHSPTEGWLCVSSLFRVNPTVTNSTHFFNAFIPYAKPGGLEKVSLGEQWGLFMMVPPTGAYYVYDGSTLDAQCNPAKWCVFRHMINIDQGDFALLVKNSKSGFRPVQSLGDRKVFFNDTEQLTGGPMPKDGKTYMRCKRSGRKQVKNVEAAPLNANKPPSGYFHAMGQWVSSQTEQNGIFALLDLLIMLGALAIGIYYGWQYRLKGLYFVNWGQKGGAYIRSLFVYLYNLVFVPPKKILTSEL